MSERSTRGFEQGMVSFSGTVDALLAEPTINVELIPGAEGIDSYIRVEVCPKAHNAECVDIFLTIEDAEVLKDLLTQAFADRPHWPARTEAR